MGMHKPRMVQAHGGMGACKWTLRLCTALMCKMQQEEQPA